MKKQLELAERLIVAADFSPKKSGDVMKAVRDFNRLADMLAGTGVVIKVNTMLRFLGYELIGKLHNDGLRVFADLKLNDIPNTLRCDGEFLAQYQPELLTVMCSSGQKSLIDLREAIGDQTEILGVTVLTSLSIGECKIIYREAPGPVTRDLAKLAQRAKLGGLILSASELGSISVEYRMTRNCPGIRPAWHIDPNDDQDPDRIVTPAKAISAGADRIVMGRPITQHDDPREAVAMTLSEIEEALNDID